MLRCCLWKTSPIAEHQEKRSHSLKDWLFFRKISKDSLENSVEHIIQCAGGSCMGRALLLPGTWELLGWLSILEDVREGDFLLVTENCWTCLSKVKYSLQKQKQTKTVFPTKYKECGIFRVPVIGRNE